jgi:hypothetical protein
VFQKEAKFWMVVENFGDRLFTTRMVKKLMRHDLQFHYSIPPLSKAVSG